jgi:hypothetical protein
MYKLTVYYSVADEGDGSAYPSFFESKELANFIQDEEVHLGNSGWGEPCTDSISFKSDSPIITLDVTTKEDYLVESYLDSINSIGGLEDYEFHSLVRFKKQFYPDGFPMVKIRPQMKYDKSGLYNAIILDGVEIGGLQHCVSDETGEDIQERINETFEKVNNL